MTMSDDMRTGWFSVKRGMLDHDLFKPDGKWSKAEAWIWMIENAAYRDITVDVGGKPHVVPRGDLCFSERFMAEKFGWSQKALRNFLDKLEAHGAITQDVAKTGQGTKSKRKQVTLCNYDKYQGYEIKTEAKGKQKGSKEEQVTNIPPSEDAPASSGLVVDLSSPTAAVWAVGKQYLARHGVRSPGEMIGKWLKSATAIEVLAAIQAADRARTEDPIPYITEVLKGKSQGGETQPKPKRGDLKTTRDGRVLEWDGWTWECRNDLTPADVRVAHAG